MAKKAPPKTKSVAMKAAKMAETMPIAQAKKAMNVVHVDHGVVFVKWRQGGKPSVRSSKADGYDTYVHLDKLVTPAIEDKQLMIDELEKKVGELEVQMAIDDWAAGDNDGDTISYSHLQEEIEQLTQKNADLEKMIAEDREQLSRNAKLIERAKIAEADRDGALKLVKSMEEQLSAIAAENQRIVNKHSYTTTLVRENDELQKRIKSYEQMIDSRETAHMRRLSEIQTDALSTIGTLVNVVREYD